MYLLIDNKLVHIDSNEDNNKEIIAIKDIHVLMNEVLSDNLKKSIVRNKIFTLQYDYKIDMYCFRVTQSPWMDESGKGSGHGLFTTKGGAIVNMINDGYRVYSNNVEITF